MVSIIVFLRLYGPTGNTPHNPYSWGVFSRVPRKEVRSPAAAKESSPTCRRESCDWLDGVVASTDTMSLLLLRLLLLRLASRRVVDEERWRWGTAMVVGVGMWNPWVMPTMANVESMRRIIVFVVMVVTAVIDYRLMRITIDWNGELHPNRAESDIR
jgi:hypothetical protein